jgi:hypothetical protein
VGSSSITRGSVTVGSPPSPSLAVLGSPLPSPPLPWDGGADRSGPAGGNVTTVGSSPLSSPRPGSRIGTVGGSAAGG